MCASFVFAELFTFPLFREHLSYSQLKDIPWRAESQGSPKKESKQLIYISLELFRLQ